ncbi:MAG: UDP-N-acetylmuramate dehydrogenase, partial [Bacteroidota bacterium]
MWAFHLQKYLGGMVIQKNVSLKGLNTFGIDVKAAHFVTVNSEDALREVLSLGIRPLHILGGGSNLLIQGNLDGIVVKNEISGIEMKPETPSTVLVGAGGGGNWHDLVVWCLDRGLCGLENLSLIPGSVGAAPIQNIGAYGVELKDVFFELEAVHIETGELQRFDRNACRFGYRESIFKQELKGKYFITRVWLRLSTLPCLNTGYGDIQKTLSEMGISNPGIRDVSNAVIQIRKSKLPDPAVIGNAGSFFKNPEVTQDQFRTLQAKFPDIPNYPQSSGTVKIPAGWLIQRTGWKGRQLGKAGCHDRQALVLVNLGGATGAEVLTL